MSFRVPAALGRIDEGLPLFSKAQQESWLQMCREVITPAYDITPEMITHTVVVDPKTCKPLESGIWEQYDWNNLPVDQEELVVDYITTRLPDFGERRINTRRGHFSRWVWQPRSISSTRRLSVSQHARLQEIPRPYFFKRVSADGPVETPVWYADREAGTAVGEIIASHR